MRSFEIIESASNEIAMHQQVRAAFHAVSKYIYDGNHLPKDVEFGGYGDFYVYTSREIGLELKPLDRPSSGPTDALIMIGLRKPNTIGMSGMIMKFSRLIFGCGYGLIVYGMHEYSLKDLRQTVNSVAFLNVFEHEYLHLLDEMRTVGEITSKIPIDTHNHQQYYNDPAEFNAYYHDIAKHMLDLMHDIAADPTNAKDYLNLYNITGDYQSDLGWMLTKDLSSRRFVASLTPERRRALLRRLYRLHQQMMATVNSK